jgi:hypothetical protein
MDHLFILLEITYKKTQKNYDVYVYVMTVHPIRRFENFKRFSFLVLMGELPKKIL